MISFSTTDTLTTLIISIPEWTSRLDNLNGQIAKRQIELARLTEEQRPPTRTSIRNKGSTESLRPKDGPTDIADDGINIDVGDRRSSVPIQEDEVLDLPQESSIPAEAIALPSPDDAPADPRPGPELLTRQSSQPVPPTQSFIKPAVMKKRKTESLASAESNVPKYRTRSMIIVYYDSAVQNAFEGLVRFISSSRNNMRKGKMAQRMVEMKKAAEVENDDEDDGDLSGDQLLAKIRQGYRSTRAMNSGPQGRSPVRDKPAESNANDDGREENTTPMKLRFVSTRQMVPPRAAVAQKDGNLTTMNPGMLRGYRRGGAAGATPDVFDDLDKRLEWCQSQCEHAAHQFLRDGDCGPEIENIKGKLAEVITRAEAEIKQLKYEESSRKAIPGPTPLISREGTPELEGKSRSLKSIHVRREATPNPSINKKLEVDAMEVDEGFGDSESPPTLIFKRTRDIA